MFRGCGGAKSRVGKTTVTDERTSTESMIMPDDGFLSLKSYKSVLHIYIQAGGEEGPWSALGVDAQISLITFCFAGSPGWLEQQIW